MNHNTYETDEYYGYIYLTTNLINNKMYIGQHRGKFNARYLGSGLYIKRAVKKYGQENFKVELLHVAKTLEELNILEIEYIKKYNAYNDDNFYNLSNGGEGNSRICSEETKKKISKALKGKLSKEKHPLWGKHHSIETKNKISQANKGRYVGSKSVLYKKRPSKKTIKKMREAKKGKYMGQNNPNYGKYWTEEQKKLQSERMKEIGFTGKNNPMYGKTHSLETKKKLSEFRKDKFKSAENPNSKTVIQLDKNLNFIRKYDSMTDATVFGFRVSGICSCCKHNQIYHKNYIWLYEDEYIEIIKEK